MKVRHHTSPRRTWGQPATFTSTARALYGMWTVFGHFSGKPTHQKWSVPPGGRCITRQHLKLK